MNSYRFWWSSSKVRHYVSGRYYHMISKHETLLDLDNIALLVSVVMLYELQ